MGIFDKLKKQQDILEHKELIEKVKKEQEEVAKAKEEGKISNSTLMRVGEEEEKPEEKPTEKIDEKYEIYNEPDEEEDSTPSTIKEDNIEDEENVDDDSLLEEIENDNSNREEEKVENNIKEADEISPLTKDNSSDDASLTNISTVELIKILEQMNLRLLNIESFIFRKYKDLI